MKHYGPTIRKIRLDKGFSQKEVYTGITSKTYAIEFEKGLHEMTVPNFVLILDRLLMDFKEFQYIHHGYHSSENKRLHNRFADASNHHDLPALKKILQESTLTKSDINKVLTAQVRLSIFSIEHNHNSEIKDYPQADIAIIHDYLMRLESWTLEEIILFANCAQYFSFETRTLLTETVIKNILKYREFSHYQKLLSGLLINSLSDVFLLREKKLATRYLKLLEEISREIEYTSQREIYLFFQGLYEILWGDLTKGNKTCRYFIEHFEIIGHQNYATLFKAFLKKINTLGD